MATCPQNKLKSRLASDNFFIIICVTFLSSVRRSSWQLKGWGPIQVSAALFPPMLDYFQESLSSLGMHRDLKFARIPSTTSLRVSVTVGQEGAGCVDFAPSLPLKLILEFRSRGAIRNTEDASHSRVCPKTAKIRVQWACWNVVLSRISPETESANLRQVEQMYGPRQSCWKSLTWEGPGRLELPSSFLTDFCL